MKKICILLVLALLLGLAVPTALAEDVNPLNVPDEGYRIDGDGWYSVNAWCKNGDDDIFGRLYFPADFDETQQYTTVLLVHGMTLNADFWHKCYAPALASAGYVCYAFDERSGTQGGRGSFSTPLESGVSGVAETVSDANAALDFIQTLNYVNKEQIYLFGNSKGSMSVQVLASQRSPEIAGVVALYGGISSESTLVPNVEEVLAHPYDNGEVLVIWGAGDSGYSLDSALENMALYPEATLLLISKAFHGFGNQVNRPAVICAQAVVDYLDRCANGIPNEKKKESSAGAADLEATEELYTYAGEGYLCTVQHAFRDGVDIFGRMYYPADFDAERQYPVIIAAHGGGGTADVWDKTIAPRIVQQGECLVYAFDAQSETANGRGSYSTPLEGVEPGRNTVENFADDMDIALDYVKGLAYVDPNGIYLMGGSKGGATTQLEAARRPDEIAGIIVQSGGLGDDNSSMIADYEALKAAPYDGEVLFVQGVDDQQCLIARGEANMSWYELNTFVAISSTGHGFGYQNDRSTEIFVDSVNEFIHRTYYHIGE